MKSNAKAKQFDIERVLNVVVSDVPHPSAVVSADVECDLTGTRVVLEYVLNNDMKDLNAFMTQLTKVSTISMSWLDLDFDRVVASIVYEDLVFQGHRFEFDSTEPESQFFLVSFHSKSNAALSASS